MDEEPDPAIATCVVGAGPAGLLFCLVAGIRRRQLDIEDAWPIALVDKRDSYERTHRLRMDNGPYLAARDELQHELFDELITFLESERFRPAANALESVLLDLVSRLGISKTLAHVGSGPGEFDIRRLRSAMHKRNLAGSRTQLTVVGADSVNSATRALVAGDVPTVERVHQTVVRLRLDGDELPDRLNRVNQFKLAKLLGSALDYRANPNGFAEVDLFLNPDEHDSIVALGARPSNPVQLTPELLTSIDAPLFSQVVRYMMGNLGRTGVEVSVSSTFRLEHRYSEQVTFSLPELHTHVLLVGDAAVSLPFFRGMACLMKSVSALVRAHTDMATATEANRVATACARYNDDVAAIRAKEVRTVETRARAVRLARELVRVSSLSPFPMQTWLLSIRPLARPSGRLTNRLVATMVIATAAAALAISSPQLGLLGLLSLPLQAAAGHLYRSSLDDWRGPNAWISRFCRLQMLALIVAGAVIAIVNPFDSGIWIRLGASIGWFALGVVFIAGMYTAEFGRRYR
ncbi:MAG: hypothetical protein HKN24_09800 [Acidimicrobiales bacterium]|nr:hypothetical protein [Acidimicrobiales bacterium]